MEHYIFFMLLQLSFTIIVIGSGSNVDFKLFSNSVIGPYQMIFKQTYNCNPNRNVGIQYNAYISHKGNKTLILGNTTSNIPLDDTLFLEMRLAIKDSFGHWKENVYIHKLPNACSTMKKLLGNAWTPYLHGIGIQKTECPLLPGIYIAPGVDTSIIEKSNFPKSLIYGTYKFHVMYQSKTNEILGCQVYILEVKRI